MNEQKSSSSSSPIRDDQEKSTTSTGARASCPLDWPKAWYEVEVLRAKLNDALKEYGKAWARAATETFPEGCEAANELREEERKRVDDLIEEYGNELFLLAGEQVWEQVEALGGTKQ